MLLKFRDSAGMTLIELMIVLGIIGVLAMAAAPRFAPSIENANFETGADLVASELRFARNRAINFNTEIGVNLGVNGTGNLTIQVINIATGEIIHQRTVEGAWAPVDCGDFGAGPRFSPRGLPSNLAGVDNVITVNGPGGRVRSYTIFRTTGVVQ